MATLSVPLMTDHKALIQLLNLHGTHATAGILLQITVTQHSDAFYGPQNRVRENEVNGAPLRWGLPGCSSGGHQSKVLITRPLCLGALAEAEPDASSNVRFFLSDLVSQASCWKVQEASSALGSIRPTLTQVSKPNTSANSCDMPC